jgi:hypothetical protein
MQKTLWAASLYGHDTRTGRVDLSDVAVDGSVVWQTQVSIDEARAFALSILEAAEAAESDEVFMSWLRDDVGVGETERAGKMLVALRAHRTARKG